MAVDERRRSQLFEGLAGAIGPEQASTMFELLPPAGVDVATRQDVAQLEARMDAQFARVDERFERIDERFERTDDRFTALEHRIDDRLDVLRGELLAAFRGELVSAVAGQTRAVVTATIATALSVTGAAVALAQLL